MIKAIIIDDEKDARDNLKNILLNFIDGVEVIGVAENAIEGMKLVKNNKVDVIFLDIEMPNANGFDFIECTSLKAEKIVFTTAYEKYAMQAIKAKAYDYILKPIDISELEEIINNIKSSINHSSNELNSLGDQISLPTTNGITFLKFNKIIYIKGEGSYSNIKLIEGSDLVISKNLKYFEDKLKGGFIRCHKSFIVNLNHVVEFSKKDGGFLKMENEDVVYISNSMREEVLYKLMK